MAVMTARSIARRLVNISHLSSLYHQAVEDMRRDAVNTTVNTLWNRYRSHQKREEPRSFVDWLVEKQHLENTFWHRTTGTGVATRRRWAFGYFRFLTRKELTLADDPSNLWMFDALEAKINSKHDDLDWVIVVETVNRDGIPRYRLQPGVSFMFGKVERKADEPE
jgi:hypothetical protein